MKKKDLLTAFQIYLYEKKIIPNNHDWDFEKESKKFLKKIRNNLFIK